MLQQWKESVTAPICKKGDKCTVLIMQEYHCHLLDIKIVFDILPEFIGDNQCDLCPKKITDQILCICQTLRKKWEYNGRHQLFIDSKKACDSVQKSH